VDLVICTISTNQLYVTVDVLALKMKYPVEEAET